MTIKKLLEKYKKISKSHEMVCVTEIVRDLYRMQMVVELRKSKIKKKR